ncbi:MAG: fructose-bisphosphate aldolase class I [Actinomycetota bacterium]|nr:fructose-bisphosphate aldolase class I [Actinomycetota bacterium]
MHDRALSDVAAAMVDQGKGVLAADESVATISKRFKAHGIESTEETRRSYRQLLFSHDELPSMVSGVILHEETLGQRSNDGTPFPQFLDARGILPGIKVDIGTRPLCGAPGELVTNGLDGLEDKVAGYREAGARFAKWRAVLRIGTGMPSPWALQVNADALARYAGLCQQGDLVPIVEPEVLMEGDHDLDTCAAVTRRVLAEVIGCLVTAGVDLRAMVLKPSMVVPGAEGPPATVSEVAAATIRCLLDTVPASVPGVAFLSGGQPGPLATAHLDAIVRQGPHPWGVTFSYGRALQDNPLRIWDGEHANVDAAQAALIARARCNSAAALGRYDEALEAAS